ncbi:MAG: VPS10 domain-containing protein [Pirellulaceae bacterium]
MCHSLLQQLPRRLPFLLFLLSAAFALCPPGGAVRSQDVAWEPLGLSGGGGMFTPTISPVDPNLMLINCDMSGAYISRDGGHHWRMINHLQLRSDTGCRPAFHPQDPHVLYASSGGQLRVSRDGGETFAPIGNLEKSLGGEIAIHPVDPHLMLVGTRDGVCYLSLDAGETWTACSGPQGQLMGCHFDRTTHDRTSFLATDQGIWRSDDRGSTWAQCTAGLPWTSIQGFAAGSNAVSGVTMLYCSVRSEETQGRFAGGIYVSNDRGDSWQSAMGQGINTQTTKADEWAYGSIAQYHQLLTSDVNPLLVYAMNTSTGFHPPHHETVYRSDDGGRTWRDVYFMDPRFERYNIAPNYVTASTGKSWKGGNAPFGAAICNSDPQRIILTRSDCHITHTGGESWFHGDTYPAAGETPQPGSAWTCNGLVVTTTWHHYIDPCESNRHYIAYTDLGFARSLDAGRTWIWWDPQSWAPWRNTCYEIAFDPAVPGKMWGGFSDVHDIPNDNIISERHGHEGPGGVCISRDFGATWQVEAKGLPARPVTSIVLDPRSPAGQRTLYAGVFMAGVFKSTDDGATWTLQKNGLGDPENMRVYRVILHRDGTLFASICARRKGVRQPLQPEGVGLYRSRDQGESWEKVNRDRPFLYPKDFSVHPEESNDILLGTCDVDGNDQQGGLYRTRDGGKTWQRIGRQGRQTFGGYFHPDHRGWIYMTLTEGAPAAGLWLSRDDGHSWEPFNDLPFSNIQRVAFDAADPHRMYVTTFGGSVWRGPQVPMANSADGK